MDGGLQYQAATRDAYNDGFYAGQLAMRERAAHAARYWYELPEVPEMASGTVENIIEAVIHALQPEEPQ